MKHYKEIDDINNQKLRKLLREYERVIINDSLSLEIGLNERKVKERMFETTDKLVNYLNKVVK